MAHDDIPPDLAAYGSRKEPNLSAEDVARCIPRWSYWANLAAVDVMDAVYLSLNIEAKAARVNQDAAKRLPGVKDRLDIALSNMAAGRLPSYLTEADRYHGSDSGTAVKLPEFRAWGESLAHPFTFPDEFPRAATPEHAAPVASKPSQDKSMTTKERNTLLRIIRALDVMAKLPDRGPATSIVEQLQQLGFRSPIDDTVRKVINEARGLEKD